MCLVQMIVQLSFVLQKPHKAADLWTSLWLSVELRRGGLTGRRSLKCGQEVGRPPPACEATGRGPANLAC